VFGSILESSGCSLYLPGLPGNEVDEAQVGCCRGCFVRSLLGCDAFLAMISLLVWCAHFFSLERWGCFLVRGV
jgi:hypothetical protein